MFGKRSKLGAPRRVRGLNGGWQTYDLTGGAVRETNGWNAARLGMVDGGGAVLFPTGDDSTEDVDGRTDAWITTRKPTRRAPRTTRTGRKGGR